MSTRRDHEQVRRVLGLRIRPMTRAEIYEAADIDHIDQLDAALQHMVAAGQVLHIAGEPARHARPSRSHAQ